MSSTLYNPKKPNENNLHIVSSLCKTQVYFLLFSYPANISIYFTQQNKNQNFNLLKAFKYNSQNFKPYCRIKLITIFQESCQK